MTAKNIFLLGSMVFLLSACGGSEESPAQETIQSPTAEVLTPTVTSYINLAGVIASNQNKNTKVLGAVTSSRGVVGSSIANTRANIVFSQINETVQGNVSFLLEASDADGIAEVNLVLPSVNKSISLCSSDCGFDYEKSIIGLSPVLYGVTPGEIRLEIWITDTLDNQVLADAITFNWQPYQIEGVTAQRDEDNINISWQANPELNRYNVYIATQAGVSSTNINELENGQQFLSIQDTALSITESLTDKSYQVLITGVDGSGESGFANTINIAPVGGELAFAPEANADQFQISEDQTLQGNVLTNDTNQYSGDLRVNADALILPQHGTLNINENGDFTYIPIANFNGEDAFSYQVANELGMTDTAVVEITILAVNDAPIALDNTYNITNNGALVVLSPGLLINDSDIDLDNLTVDTTPVNEPKRGQLTLFDNGGFEYQGEQNMQGEDSFQYRVVDAQGAQAIANVTIVSSNTNVAPVTKNDSYSLSEDETLVVTAANGVLSNDTDPNNDSFSVDETFIVAPTHGQLLLAIDGSFSYVPDANFNGVDQFQYQAIDALGATSTATVTLIINSEPDNPVAQNDAYQFSKNKLFEVTTQNGLLVNDFNIEAGDLSVNTTAINTTQNGELTLKVDGSFTYQPDLGFIGVDSFTYSISNEQGLTATAQVTLSESGVNTFPEANDDQYTLGEDSSASLLDVLANDTDADGDTITISNIQNIVGEATIVAGKIQFTPPANFSGEIVLTYTITDGYSVGNEGINDRTASVTITVTPVNDAPIANADSVTMNEDGPAVLVNVLANDSDIDGDTLAITAATADIGSASVVDNKIQYTPVANTNGTAIISYTISDGSGGTATTNLTITILPINDTPIANADSATIDEDAAPILINVLANDSDVDGDSLMISAVSADTGSVSVISNQIQYTPETNSNGLATVTYTVSDSSGGTSTTTLTITITPVNDAPVANADLATMAEDAAPILINVLANDSDVDGDSLTISAASADIGTVSVVGNQIQYAPAADSNGLATVTYTVSDNNGGTNTATVTITITAVNDAPVANNDTATMAEDAAPILINVLANDSDEDGDSLTISAASANIGSVSVVGNQIQYTPAADSNGLATVTYTVSDNNGGTNTATVAITITAVNDAPIANNDTATMAENAAPILINVLANDSDIDGDSLAITSASADIGSVSVVGNQIQYTPAPNENGLATITYTVSDNNGGTNTATLTITITAVNDAPVANNDTATMAEDAAPILINVLANDTDSDGDSLVIASASADIGSVSIIGDKIQYTPATNINGLATVTYTVSDNNGGTNTATVAITVTAVNDAPVASVQIFSINENATDGDIIGTVSASDIENQTLTYSLTGGDTALFEINSSSGVLSTAGESPFDFETTNQYILNITITDDGTPNESSNVNITVNITDEVELFIPTEDVAFGRPITGELDLSDIFSGGEFKDSIELNGNLYFVGFTNNADKDLLIVSYSNNGDMNTAFNNTGTKILDLDQDEEATAIISDGTDLFIAYSSFDGTHNEACILKMDLAGTLSTGSDDDDDDDDDDESGADIQCTTLNSTTVINDLEIDGDKLLAVGKHFDGTQNDSLWIHYKKSDLDFENSTPAIVDVSGANRDDEGFAVKNFDKSDYLVVGSVTNAEGTKDSLLRYLKSDGDNDNNFNGGAALTIDISDNNTDDELFAVGGVVDSEFTAFAGGYVTRTSGEKEAVVLAINEDGELITTFGSAGIAIYDVDGNGGNGNGGAKISGIKHEPINNGISFSGTTGVSASEKLFSARINDEGTLDGAYGTSGINIIDGISGKQFANTLAIDSNDTIWVAGVNDDSNTKPFIAAIDDKATLFSNFETNGHFTFTNSVDATNDESMHVLQLSNGPDAGKYILASTAKSGSITKLVLTRFTSAGDIDTGFSESGHKEIAIGLSNSRIALTEQSDGKLVIAGSKNSENGEAGFVAKVDQSGNLDTSFATDGVYTSSVSGAELVNLIDIALDNSGNIITVGSIVTSGTPSPIVIMLTPEGTLEPNFGTGGSIIGSAFEYYNRVHTDNADIFIGGKSVLSGTSKLIALKLSSNGTEVFKYVGEETTDTDNKIAQILTDTTGKLYLIANLIDSPNKANVIRLLVTGALDTSFALNGVGEYTLASSGDTELSGAALNSSNQLILAGKANDKGMLARILTNGTLDNTFGASGAGFYEASQCASTHVFTSIILQNDTQVVLSSTCNDTNSNNVSISKFNFEEDGA
ncbi:Ig-like domain-containing protein [Pseudoalteromonas sp. NSLLW218]|uniref:Ig-like domain-containing protein n=1 Tax=Pseudoalteromonas sp. NSLLW218 TaxID=2792048 RepID=UPI0018CD17E2|nr:Ig-like domain-containing protein [Pseudoalteromonas sp. NSLLW218]MBH0087471.1 tandem-95 repeat protein [Pseudoalteromonas sp. NSLLW218]